MRAKLQGGRFRWLNEELYTSRGEEAFRLMQEQPDLYEQYHEGFRSQTQGWPVQPVELAIAWLKGSPTSLVVADFGCGDAKIAASVKQTVHSLDLVAGAPGVLACNMAATPFESGSIDVAIFCLALMGTDYPAFLVEAHRVLRPGGWLWIAEVRSRFGAAATAPADSGKPVQRSSSSSSRDATPRSGSSSENASQGSSAKEAQEAGAFVAALERLGFKLKRRDMANKMFAVFELQKSRERKGQEQIQWPELKPCLYKRR
ncbi:hypothetical protein WJX72_005839 [[Myrmecia] bisecta]|uniref:Ribosomal RNA-processing protein 8 n=1 Tax=[Myrmecia] bisecta TaxID=41462 RepID=A0AAW1QFA0_9CHLO